MNKYELILQTLRIKPDETLRVVDLTVLTGVSNGSVRRLVSHMQDNELVSVVKSVETGDIVSVKLTEHGKKIPDRKN